MNAAESEVLAALGNVFDPCSVTAGAPVSIVDMGLVLGVEADAAGHVRIDLRPTTPHCMLIGSFIEATEQQALAVPGISEVSVRIDLRPGWTEAAMTDHGQAVLQARRERSRREIPVRPREWEDRKVRA